MKTFRMTAIAIASGLCLCACDPPRPNAVPPNGITVAQIVTAVAGGWADARNKIEPPAAYQLDSVTLTITGKGEQVDDISFSPAIVTLDVKSDTTATQAIQISLEKPKPTPKDVSIAFTDQTLKHAKLQPEDLPTELRKAVAQTIVKADAAVNEAQKAAGALPTENKLPPLASVTATVGYEITYSAKAGFGLQLGPISIGPSATNSQNASQKIDLKFVLPPPGKK